MTKKENIFLLALAFILLLLIIILYVTGMFLRQSLREHFNASTDEAPAYVLTIDGPIPQKLKDLKYAGFIPSESDSQGHYLFSITGDLQRISLKSVAASCPGMSLSMDGANIIVTAKNVAPGYSKTSLNSCANMLIQSIVNAPKPQQ